MATYISGSLCPYALIDTTDPTVAIVEIKEVFIIAGWTFQSIPAMIRLTMTEIGHLSGSTWIETQSAFNASDQVLLADIAYTFVTTLVGTSAGQVLIGSTTGESLINLFNAINADPATLGVTYSSDTFANPLVKAVQLQRKTTVTPPTDSIVVNATAEATAGNYLSATGVGAWDYGDYTSVAGYRRDKLLFGGWRFNYVSDQRFTVNCSIFDAGPTTATQNAIRGQFSSAFDPTLTGIVHAIDLPADTKTQIVVNGGGVFMSQQGVSYEVGYGHSGSCFCGGLLRVFGGVADTPPDEAWYSFGDGGSAFANPRLNLGLTGPYQASFNCEGVWGSSHVLGAASPYDPQVLYKNSAIGDGSLKIRWMSSDTDGDGGSPIVYDPFVAWGESPSIPPLVRGQIPDARISSLPTKIDDQDADPADDLDKQGYVTDLDGTMWINYTDQFLKGGLWLKADPTAVAPPPPLNPEIAQYRKIGRLGSRPRS